MKVTQVPLDVALQLEQPQAHLTQIVAEVPYAFKPRAFVTQLTAETPLGYEPKAYVTQLVVEIVRSPETIVPMRVSQYALELLHSAAATVPGSPAAAALSCSALQVRLGL